jgi:hypothetical protein
MNTDNRVIDFFKTIIGFASGAFLLVGNFALKSEHPKTEEFLFRVCILTTLILFATSVLCGLFAIKREIDGKSTNKFIYWVIVPFGLGFVTLCIGVYFNI